MKISAPPTLVGASLAVVGIGSILVAAAVAGRKSVPTIVAAPPAPQMAATPPIPRAVPPLSMPPPGPAWATIARPGDTVPDTPANRTKYMSEVVLAHAGEPPLDRAKAAPLMRRLATELAKASGAPAAAIKSNAGDTGGGITIAKGVVARIGDGDNDIAAGPCSEPFLVNAILGSGGADAFARAGIRGIICTSHGCTGVFDMRPTSSGGGMYAGEACVSMDDVLRMAGAMR